MGPIGSHPMGFTQFRIETGPFHGECGSFTVGRIISHGKSQLFPIGMPLSHEALKKQFDRALYDSEPLKAQNQTKPYRYNL